MRKVFLDDLPRKKGFGANINKDVIDWNGSVGCEVKFIYEDIEGVIKIISYNPKTSKIEVEYNNIIGKIRSSVFVNGGVGKLIGKINCGYKYNIGDIVKTNSGEIEILNFTRKNNYKGYEYRCLIDGNIDTINDGHLNKGQGCNVCSKNKVLKGVNDLQTTRPDIAKLLVDKNDAHMVSHGSGKSLKFKCEHCGYEKLLRVHYISRKGFSCNKCGDGISYPEKFVFSVLTQLGLDFHTQVGIGTFKWCEGKRYDFYIKKYNCIIEVHGDQHYNESGYRLKLKEIKKTDEIKRKNAKDNHINNYIEIDCRRSTPLFIKESIMNSPMNGLFKLNSNKINWNKCHDDASNNLAKLCCDMFNNGEKVQTIANKYKLNISTVLDYLKNGDSIGWCNYKTQYKKKHDNIKMASQLWKNGMRSTKEISKHMDMHPATISKYLLEGKNKGLCDYNSKDIMKNNGINAGASCRKKVVCINTNEIFNSIVDAHKKYNALNISNCCMGKRNAAGKHPETGEKLRWAYYDDYIKQQENKVGHQNEEVDNK